MYLLIAKTCCVHKLKCLGVDLFTYSWGWVEHCGTLCWRRWRAMPWRSKLARLQVDVLSCQYNSGWTANSRSWMNGWNIHVAEPCGCERRRPSSEAEPHTLQQVNESHELNELCRVCQLNFLNLLAWHDSGSAARQSPCRLVTPSHNL